MAIIFIVWKKKNTKKVVSKEGDFDAIITTERTYGTMHELY